MAKTEEDKDEVIGSLSDMEENSDGTYTDKRIVTTKKELKNLLKDIQLEDRLKHIVECRTKEECEKIIQLAQERIAELDKKGVKDDNGKGVEISFY